jgi:probable phosphoglycerate mutase
MRHGEVDYFDPHGRPYRPASVPINEEGRQQAEAAGRALATVPLDRVITSGLNRTVQTAQLVIAPRTLPLETRSELREIETGRLRDLTAGDELAVEQAFLGALTHDLRGTDRFLGGETFGSLLERVRPCFQAILADRTWQNLLLVAHGVVNRVLLSGILGAGLFALGGLEQDAGCINVIDVDDAGRCLIRLLNYTPLNALKAGMELTTLEKLYLQFRRGRPEPC